MTDKIWVRNLLAWADDNETFTGPEAKAQKRAKKATPAKTKGKLKLKAKKKK